MAFKDLLEKIKNKVKGMNEPKMRGEDKQLATLRREKQYYTDQTEKIALKKDIAQIKKDRTKRFVFGNKNVAKEYDSSNSEGYIPRQEQTVNAKYKIIPPPKTNQQLKEEKQKKNRSIPRAYGRGLLKGVEKGLTSSTFKERLLEDKFPKRYRPKQTKRKIQKVRVAQPTPSMLSSTIPQPTQTRTPGFFQPTNKPLKRGILNTNNNILGGVRR